MAPSKSSPRGTGSCSPHSRGQQWSAWRSAPHQRSGSTGSAAISERASARTVDWTTTGRGPAVGSVSTGGGIGRVAPHSCRQSTLMLGGRVRLGLWTSQAPTRYKRSAQPTLAPAPWAAWRDGRCPWVRKERVMQPTTTYPVHFSVDYPDRALNRVTTAFRIIVIIPIAIG